MGQYAVYFLEVLQYVQYDSCQFTSVYTLRALHCVALSVAVAAYDSPAIRLWTGS